MDPYSVTELTNVDHHIVWEILIVAYFFFGGLSIGAFLLASLETVFGVQHFRFLTRPALLTAIVSGILTPMAALAHLGQPSRFAFTLWHFHWTSPMSWGTYILIFYILMLMIHGALFYFDELVTIRETATGLRKQVLRVLLLLAGENMFRHEARREVIRRATGILALVAVPHFAYTGIELGIIQSRPLWHSALNGIMFLLTGVLSGLAFTHLLWMMSGRGGDRKSGKEMEAGIRHLSLAMAGLLILFLGLNLIQVITSVYSGEDSHAALILLLTGDMGMVFSGIGILVGSMVPLVLFLHPAWSIRRGVLAIAHGLLLIGTFATKYGFVIGGQMVPRTGAAYLHYVPSSLEILQLTGVLGFGALLFLLGYAILPMRPKGKDEAEVSPNASTTRRMFLGTTAVASAGLFAFGYGPVLLNLFRERGKVVPPDPLERPEHIVYSGCLMCHGECGIRCKVIDGRLVKIDGNPYHPNTLEDFLPQTTDPVEAVRTVGKVCAKGQSGVQTLYDPHRLTQPLKRSGPRGSGQWITVSWEQALREIIEGGNVFKDVPGEETRTVDGLKALRKLADRDKVMADWQRVKQGGLSPEAFRARYQDVLIDPEAPELGPKANQVALMIGRANHGRKEFTDRFFRDSFGTVNYRNDHTSICELSHHVAFHLATGGKKHHLKPDIMNAEFVLFFGASPLEAEFPMQAMARKVVEAVNGGALKYALIDPRFSNSASKAWRWVPILPGTDGALAMALCRWIMEHHRYDQRFLENTTLSAAQEDGETAWSDASYLVRLDTGAYLRPADVWPQEPADGFVVQAGGKLHRHDRVSHGELDGAGTVEHIPYKSAFGLIKDRAFEHSLDEYAQICGIEVSTIRELAEEFTSHGKKAATEFYRGPAQHTNGVYSGLAIIALNFLIGNVNWKGGLAVGGGHWHEMGDKPGQRYPVKHMHPGKVKAWGVPISREQVRYEDSTEFQKNGYPAKRPWFPLTKNIWQEFLAGIASGYPYAPKALFLLKGAPSYSVPGMGPLIEETLKDPKKVPLFVAFDIVMGGTSCFADYILPDVTIYDGQWATPHLAPTILTKVSHVRQPVVPKLYPETRAVEDVLIDIGIRMGLPGYGEEGLGPGKPLTRQEDWYRTLISNIAYGDRPGDEVPGETEEQKVAYVLARGGRFEGKDQAYDGAYLGHKFMGLCHLYSEEAGTTIDSMTGTRFSGVPHYEPGKDALERPLREESSFPFRLISYKLAFHTQSRTMANSYLREILDENSVEMNAADGERLGLKTGMRVRVSSSTNPEGITGPVQLLQGMRPGVVAVCHHFGQTQYGSRSYAVNGIVQSAESERGNGINPNPLMQIDPAVGLACLQDKVGGSASFFETFVRVEKA